MLFLPDSFFESFTVRIKKISHEGAFYAANAVMKK